MGNLLAFQQNLLKWTHVCNTWRRDNERYCHEILHLSDVLVNFASIFCWRLVMENGHFSSFNICEYRLSLIVHCFQEFVLK